MKTATAFILSLAAILIFTASTSFAKYSGGTGEIGDPYKIGTKADLLTLAADANDYSKYFILTADIDLSGKTFTHAVIAPDTDNATWQFEGTLFTGVFDGNDHIIRNIVINTSTDYYVGLFGYVGPAGQVINLGIKDISITGTYYIGGLAGGNNGTLSSCYSTGSVGGSQSAGGLIGYNGGTLTASYSTCSANGSYYIGSLVGYSAGAINLSYAAGSVSGTQSVGGLAGYNTGSITSCYATGSTSGTMGYAGGLVGMNYTGTLTDCYATGSVSGTSGIGGLVGYNYNGTLTSCFWDKDTSGLTGGVGLGFSAGASGGTTAQMQMITTFTAEGWDFNDIWKMPPAVGYPILSWQKVTDVPVVLPLNIQVAKCTVAAGSKYLAIADKISFSGTIDANADDFNDANNSIDANFVKVTISSVNVEDMDPCVFTFPVNNKTYKKGKFKSAITSKPLKMSFAFDTKKTTFSFSAANVDLTGLSCPVIVTIQIGNSSGFVSLDETIVNSTKKLIPYQLMMGVQNSLVANKMSVKHGKKLGTDSLKASGQFTTTGEPDLYNPMVITVGNQTFSVPGNLFVSKNGILSCRNVVSDEGPVITATLNYVKCTFIVSVKNASIIQTGEVNFDINCFGVNLAGLETINLGP